MSPDEWVAARKALLVKEKEHTRRGDVLSRKRPKLPWLAIDKEYVFEGPDGDVSLAELFETARQL